MSQGLFRQEVVDARRGDWLGSIVVAAPLLRWLLAALALATATLLFLFVGHHTCRETVSTQLLPGIGLLNIAAPAKVGQVVRADWSCAHRRSRMGGIRPIHGQVADVSRRALVALVGQPVQQQGALYPLHVPLDSWQLAAYGEQEPVRIC